jgi:hypothetical protein
MLCRGVKYDIVKDIDVHPCWRWTFVVNDRRRVGGQTKSAAELPKSKCAEQSTRHWDRSAQIRIEAGALPIPINRATFLKHLH